jgi:hypothetical protein
MEPACPHGDPPESAVLRVVLTSAIVQADAARLAMIAALMQRLGLLDPAEGEAYPDGSPRGQRSRRLCLLTSVP